MIITLSIQSLIGTVLAIATREDEDFTTYYAVGFIGWIVSLFCLIVRRIIHWNKYHDKRSIFKNEETGKQYWCRLKDTNDITWVKGYKLVKRYAPKSEWCSLDTFDKSFIENSKCNCEHCKYDESCTFSYYGEGQDKIRCKHDEYGTVTEFDKFEKSRE